MRQLKRACFILAMALSTLSLNAQDSLSQKKVKVLPVPSFGYAPETKTYVGAVSLLTLNFYQDGKTRVSNAKVEFNYTWRKQSIFEVGWDYFFREEKWFTQGEIHFSKYPDFYYGIGPDTPEAEELLYESNRTTLQAGLFRNLGQQLFVGMDLKYLNYQNVSSEGDLNRFGELQDTQIYGLQVALFKDSRNNLLTPTAGRFYKFELGQHFGDKNYGRLALDLRQYRQIKNKHTLAFRLYNRFTLNTPAFYDYSVLGGDQFVRGYFFGRFRDRHLSTLQAEFRTHLFWKLGMAAFGGISTVYPDFSSITDHLRPNYGLGLRFLVDKEGDTYLRLDYALGTANQSGFYISFGESF